MAAVLSAVNKAFSNIYRHKISSFVSPLFLPEPPLLLISCFLGCQSDNTVFASSNHYYKIFTRKYRLFWYRHI